MPRLRAPILALAVAAAAVVVVPAGLTGAGARAPARVVEGSLAEDVRCADAEQLAAGEREAVGGRLEGSGSSAEVLYEVRLEKFVSDACKPQKGCPDLARAVAALKAGRDGALDPGDEAELARAEDAFLRKHCSS